MHVLAHVCTKTIRKLQKSRLPTSLNKPSVTEQESYGNIYDKQYVSTVQRQSVVLDYITDVC